VPSGVQTEYTHLNSRLAKIYSTSVNYVWSLTMKPNAKPISKSKAGKIFPTQPSNDPDSPSTTVADWKGAVLKQGGVVIGHARTLPRKPQQTAPKTPI
jgi:hypothetical protein